MSVDRMRALDEMAIIRYGIPRLLLMDHAGQALARGARMARRRMQRPVVICCGTGYNGGDGFAAARHFASWGQPTRIILAGRMDQLRREPAIFARIARRLRIPLVEITMRRHLWQAARLLRSCDVIVDALLGIGVHGALREPVRSLITQINAAGVPVVSADVPSGLDADSGLAHDDAIRATITVTFGRVKQGCLTQAGRSSCGRLVVDPITFPHQLLTGGVS